MAPRQVIEAPPATPPTFGVFANLPRVEDPDLRWAGMGVTFEPERCASGFAAAVDCGVLGEEVTIANGGGTVNADPFFVGDGDRCSAMSFGTRDWSARAQRNLVASQSYTIADELWNGGVRNGAGLEGLVLTDTTSDNLTPDADGIAPLDALACLEYALGRKGRGRLGYVFITTQLLTHLATLQAIRLQGNAWYTHAGHRVITDAGFDGTGPGGWTGGGQYAYATSDVRLRVGPIEAVPGSRDEAMNQMDRRTNTVQVVAGRMALIQWDECVHVACAVDLPICAIDGTS